MNEFNCINSQIINYILIFTSVQIKLDISLYIEYYKKRCFVILCYL